MTWRADQSEFDTLALMLADMRGNGWAVAAHNDYTMSGNSMTFWLFTHPTGVWVQGEALDDRAAVLIARRQAQERQP